MKKALTLSCLALLSLSVQAKDDYYDGRYVLADGAFLGTELGSHNLNLKALSGGVGYQFNPHLGIEARFLAGLADDSFNNGAGRTTLKLESGWSGYLVPTLPLNEQWGLHALLGVSRLKVRLDDGISSLDGSEDDFSYGLGAQFHYSRHGRLSLEYVSLLDKHGLKVDSLNLGLRYHF
ncbi:porin family protein [Gallaecimonas sp. GXIMD4217]|uniref:porin family protein n=1 Tax=Gallaecimonas sp. GXIMD4217 TaxID=3131927 RepID=UPI00311B3E04